MDYNTEQQEAILSTEGRYRIIAGAGTGKTGTLAGRFAWLVNDLGILPGRILCVTFTNKAAAEMRARIHQMTGDKDTGLVMTFHGLCTRILSEDIHALSWPRSFVVLDNADIDDLLAILYEERGLTSRDSTYAKARDYFEYRKLETEPAYWKLLTGTSLEELRRLYMDSTATNDILFYGYLYHARRIYGLDYNDLIVLTLEIFRQHPETAAKWQDALEYIMIDEFQDIDKLQYQLMQELAKGHHNLFVVGDPDQTIYSWRNASLKWLMEFNRDFANVQTIKLTQNYRSTPQILDAANSVIAHNANRIEKRLVSRQPAGRKPLFFYGRDEKEEAARIADHIQDLLDTGESPQEIAVLYRAHYMSRPVEEELVRRNIPYRIGSGLPFYERTEIKDALAWLRMLLYQDDLSFLRTANKPARSLGKKRMAILKERALETGRTLYQCLREAADTPDFARTGAKDYIALVESVQTENCQTSDVLAKILDLSGYEQMLRQQGAQDRLDNLAELKQAVRSLEAEWGEQLGVEDYIRMAALNTGQDTPGQGDSIQLLTIHTAKGMEFGHVIVTGMNEGKFPSARCKSQEAMEEERRIFFVAMTRARQTLLCTGCRQAGKPSRFLAEPLEGTVRYEPADGWEQELAHSDNHKFLELAGTFGTGQRIIHPVFGPGTIEETDLVSCCWKIRFDKLQTCRTLGFKAKLKREEEEDGTVGNPGTRLC